MVPDKIKKTQQTKERSEFTTYTILANRVPISSCTCTWKKCQKRDGIRRPLSRLLFFLQSEQKVLAPILRRSRIQDEALAAVGTPTVYAGTARRLAETGKGGRKRKRPSRLRLQTLGVNDVCLKVTPHILVIISVVFRRRPLPCPPPPACLHPNT